MASQRIEPAPAEALVIAYLSDQMPRVDVRGFRTGAPKHRQLQVRKTGGWPVDPAVDSAQLTVTAWGTSTDDEADTERLANLALSWLRRIDITGVIGNVVCRKLLAISLPYADPDPTTGRSRYTFTIALDLRGIIHPL